MTLSPFDEGYVAPEPAAAPAPAAEKTDAERKAEYDAFRLDFNLGDPKPRNLTDPFDRANWGLFPDIAAEDYHRDPCPDVSISNSGISKLLGETPQDFAFNHPRLNKEGAGDNLKATLASRRGDIVHQLALGKGKGYAVGDFPAFQSAEAKAFKKAAEKDGLTPIIKKNFLEAERIAEVVRERIKRALDGASYQTEVAFWYQEMTRSGPIWVRGMMDVWCPELGVILDPKITARIYGDKVQRHMVDMGWDRQSALYTHAVGTIIPELAGRVRFADLMVKPEAPFTSRLVAPEKAWEATSIWECRRAFELFGECLYSNEWPGFPDTVERLPCPPWEDKRREAFYTDPVK